MWGSGSSGVSCQMGSDSAPGASGVRAITSGAKAATESLTCTTLYLGQRVWNGPAMGKRAMYAERPIRHMVSNGVI